MRRIDDATAFGRVAVLFGGDSSEREVSLMSGEAVLAALRERGVDAVGFDPAKTTLCDLPAAGVDRVWNALHGRGGEGGAVQGALQMLGLPYTGSGVLGSALALDKVRSKILFEAAGLPTPRWRAVEDERELGPALAGVGLPCFVKPASEGSSVGMSRVDRPEQLPPAWRLAREADPVVLIEALVDGPEYTAGVLGRDVLPLIEIETPNVFYDYEAKYFSEETQFHCPCGLPAEREAELAALSLEAFDTVAASGWGRVDFMLDADGRAQFLEVNTIPGMTSHSLVPKAAVQAGIDFPALVWRVLETSFPNEDRT